MSTFVNYPFCLMIFRVHFSWQLHPCFLQKHYTTRLRPLYGTHHCDAPCQADFFVESAVAKYGCTYIRRICKSLYICLSERCPQVFRDKLFATLRKNMSPFRFWYAPSMRDSERIKSLSNIGGVFLWDKDKSLKYGKRSRLSETR